MLGKLKYVTIRCQLSLEDLEALINRHKKLEHFRHSQSLNRSTIQNNTQFAGADFFVFVTASRIVHCGSRVKKIPGPGPGSA